MRLCVFGAGAVGGFVGGMAARSGAAVSLVARGPHLDAIRRDGLRVVHEGGEFAVQVPATDDPEELGPHDIVFLAVKAHGLAAAAGRIAPLLGPDTAVVSAQNGIPFWYFHAHGGRLDGHSLETVDPGGRLAARIGCERVIGCVITSSNEVPRPGVVRNVGNRTFALGEPDGSRSERLAAAAAVLEGAGLEAPTDTDIRGEVWAKMLGNVSFSPMAALTSARFGSLLERGDLRRVAVTVMEEVRAVGESLGVTFTQDIGSRVEATRRVAGHRSSILQDLERGRPMEVDGVTGAVIELGRLTGVATPTTDMIYALLRARAREAGLYPETGFDPLQEN